MPETNDPNDPRGADVPAPRVTETGITEVGFDDPELRPLPPEKMHYHVPHPDPHPEQHEHSDVPIRPLAVALVAIAATCVISGLLLYGTFWYFKREQDAQERPRTAVTGAKSEVPGPRLQGVPGFSDNHPTLDMNDLRDRYAAELEGKGTDGRAPAGIPIERAMDLAIERKMFPVAARPGADTGNPRAPAGRAPTTRPAGRGANR